jgi:hypothetical protein
MKNFKIIFLTGHRKSGTSVFHKLFNNHPEISVFPTDPAIFYAYFGIYDNENYSFSKKIKRIRRILTKVLKDHYHEQYIKNDTKKKVNEFVNIFSNRLDKNSINSRSKVLLILAETWIEINNQKNVKFFLLKETSQLHNYFEFIKLPLSKNRLKFISLVRNPLDNFAALNDGLEVYYSKIGEDYEVLISSFIFRLRADLVNSIYLSRQYKSDVKIIKFENLIINTQKTMKEACKFLNLKFDKELLNPNKEDGKIYSGNSYDGGKFSRLSKRNINNWKKRISIETASIIELYFHDMIIKYNYKLYFKDINTTKSSSPIISQVNKSLFFKDPF